MKIVQVLIDDVRREQERQRRALYEEVARINQAQVDVVVQYDIGGVEPRHCAFSRLPMADSVFHNQQGDPTKCLSESHAL